MTPFARLSLATLLLFSVCSAAQNSSTPDNAASSQLLNTSALYLKVRLDSPLKVSKLRPGEQLSGKLLQDVYSGVAEVFPALSVVRLTVDRLDRRWRAPNESLAVGD